MKFNRVYRPFTEWEEVPHNMWGAVKDRKEMLEKAKVFTGDHELYGKYMRQVSKEWKASCENALTDYSLNRNAWIGHAAAALALGCPEDITREAWRDLTNEQQLLANNQARSAIQEWEQRYAKSKGIRIHVDEALL